MKLSDHILRKPLYVAFGQAMAGGGITSVDLVATRDANTVTMTASDGSAAPIAGADASAAGVLTAADKTKLDSLPPAVTQDFAARIDVVAAVIDAGITHLRTAGYSAAGDGGEALYKRAGAEPAHNLKVQSADLAWWEIVPDSGILSFQVCGGVEGDVAANGAGNVTAFNDFIGYAQAFFTQGVTADGPTLRFPKGDYHFDNHLNVKASVRIQGDGTYGEGVRTASVLHFPLDSNGIIVQNATTIDDVTVPATFEGRFSFIENLHLIGGGFAGTTGYGIWLRAAGLVRNCFVTKFGLDGINVSAHVGAGGVIEGNANLWRIEGCLLKRNGRHGLFVDGADSNSGYALQVDAALNARWGIYDSSFLGNTYLACHTQTNGVANIAGNASDESSYVSFGSNRYSANAGATEAQLVATTPGTDASIWILRGPGGVGTNIPLWVAAKPVGTYFVGGPYHATDVGSRNVFVGCYREDDQGESQIRAPGMVIGGTMQSNKGSGVTLLGGNTGATYTGRVNFNNTNTFFETSTRDMSLQVNNTYEKLLQADVDSAGTLGLLTWVESSGMYVIGEHGNLSSRRPIRITSNLSTMTGGRTSALTGGEVVLPKGIFVGPSETNSRHMTNGTFAPTSGEHARGEIVWNRTPTASGHEIGWVCITAGTPGTWVEIRGLGNQTSGADQAALTNASGGTGDGTIAAMPAGGIGTAAGGWDTAVNRDAAIAAINDNFTELHTLLDEVRTTLVNFGLMKGGA